MKRLLRSSIVVLASFASALAWGLQVPGPLVETDWLARRIDDPGLVVIDVRGDAANFASWSTRARRTIALGKA